MSKDLLRNFYVHPISFPGFIHQTADLKFPIALKCSVSKKGKCVVKRSKQRRLSTFARANKNN